MNGGPELSPWVPFAGLIAGEAVVLVFLFVTATSIDPAGNRVHAPDKLPFDPNTVPAQTGDSQR